MRWPPALWQPLALLAAYKPAEAVGLTVNEAHGGPCPRPSPGRAIQRKTTGVTMGIMLVVGNSAAYVLARRVRERFVNALIDIPAVLRL